MSVEVIWEAPPPKQIAEYGTTGDPLLDIDESGELIVGGEGRKW